MRSATVSRGGRGRAPLWRRPPQTRRRWTWRSLWHVPVPQLVALAATLCGLYVLGTSQLFAITTIDAVGDHDLPVAQFRAYCKCIGSNIFLTQPAAIQARLGHIPWVQVRHVYGRLPNRIVVDAVYRHPAALWRTSVATYTVDATGQVLYDVQAPPAPSIVAPTTATVPLIYSPSDAIFISGEHVPAVAVHLALATRAGLSPDLAPTVDLFHWSPTDGLTGHSRIGWWFAMGTDTAPADVRERLMALEAAKRQAIMKVDHCNYVDLRVLPNAYCVYNMDWYGPLGPGA